MRLSNVATKAGKILHTVHKIMTMEEEGRSCRMDLVWNGRKVGFVLWPFQWAQPTPYACVCFLGRETKTPLPPPDPKGSDDLKWQLASSEANLSSSVRTPSISSRLKPFSDILMTGTSHWLTCSLIYLTLSLIHQVTGHWPVLSACVCLCLCICMSLCVSLSVSCLSLCVSLSCPLPCPFPLSLSSLCTILVELYGFVEQSTPGCGPDSMIKTRMYIVRNTGPGVRLWDFTLPLPLSEPYCIYCIFLTFLALVFMYKEKSWYF